MPIEAIHRRRVLIEWLRKLSLKRGDDSGLWLLRKSKDALTLARRDAIDLARDRDRGRESTFRISLVRTIESNIGLDQAVADRYRTTRWEYY